MALRILITGGATGIGRAIAEAFVERGDRVHICDVSAAALHQAQAELPGLSSTLADVGKPAQVDRLFDEVGAAPGGLDVLVNNAGVSGPTRRVEDLDMAGWRATFAVNLDSAFLCCRRAVPLLKAAGGGCIVNIASTAGLLGYPLRSPYAAAKWGLIGLSKTLAMELGEFGIRVNAVCPGSVRGPRMDRVIATEAAAHGVSEQSIRDAYTRQVSLRSFIDAGDIANMVLYLCSPAGACVSGQALSVDGHIETLRN